MRLLMVSRLWYEYSVGGTEIYIQNFIRTAKPFFEKIIVIVPSRQNKISIEKQDNVEIHKLPSLPIVGFLKRVNQKKSVKLFEYLDNLVSSEKIDLIETELMTYGPSLFFSIFMAGLKNKIPVVERLHAIPSTPTWISILRDVGFAKIICVSTHLSEHLYNLGVRSKKLNSIYPGINTKKFKPLKKNTKKKFGFSQKDIVILHASRIASLKNSKKELIETKGVTNLLKSFSIIAENHDNAKLMIATALPLEENMAFYETALRTINNLAEILL
jgi:glycosyltransferase involved in cell wall biosynthesis